MAPAVTLQFLAGHRVKFENGTWTQARPEIKIFDTSFIEQNVHSGGQISPEHRKNLLDFAIGDRAVASLKKEQAAVEDQRTATAAINVFSQQISPYTRGHSLAAFRALNPVSDADNQIASLVKRRTEARRAGAITALNVPSPMPVPDLDIDHIFSCLRSTLESIHDDVEEHIEKHLNTLDDTRAASWLSQGQSLDNGNSCPYCGQTTNGVALVQMYRRHFNESYQSLKKKVASTAALITEKTRESIAKAIIDHRAHANEQLQVWSEYVTIEKLSTDQDELIIASLASLAALLGSLITQKSLTPAESVGSPEEYQEAMSLWGEIQGTVEGYNADLSDYREIIIEYKSELHNEDAEELQRSISLLELAQIRHSPVVASLITKLAEAEKALKEAEERKKKARSDLSALMSTTLDQYHLEINRHLGNLGASFRIDAIKTNYTGSKPRTDYGILLRGRSVRLNGNPSFATALSEGDRRTLAFAFFIASTLSDPNLGKHIIVVDDPVSSLDRSRRNYTINLLTEIADESAQLILLAHDANFLREAGKAMVKQNQNLKVSTLQVTRVANAYSALGSIDLDRECETPYFTHYRVVDEYLEGKHADVKQTAVALRPLLEGYLHRKFPGKLPTDLTLGSVLTQMESAPTPGPFDALRKTLPEFRELNTFAGKFHHDTNPGFITDTPDANEVAAFGHRVLAVIHG